MTTRLQVAIDACAGPASVALFVDGVLQAARRIDRKGSAELLAPTVSALLGEHGAHPRDITDVIVGSGPGSFTGLRVAAALGKGLARGAGARLHAVPSLPLTVASLGDAPVGVYVAVLDALRGEWFMQMVSRHADGRWTVSGPVERVDIAAVRQRAASLGATLIGPPIDLLHQPDARAAFDVGPREVALDAWEPDYGRLAEAQVQWEATHARSLPTS